MKKKQKDRRTLFLWLLLFFIITVSYGLPRILLRSESRIYRLCRDIQPGMTREQVLKVLGRPERVEDAEVASSILSDATEPIQDMLIYKSPGRLVSAQIFFKPDNKVLKVICPIKRQASNQ